MKIILSKEETEIIHEALLTEEERAVHDIIDNNKKGRSPGNRYKRIEDIIAVRERFEPYARGGK